MKGIVKTGYTLNIRDANNAVIGTLKVNDTVYGDVINNRIYYTRIYRADETIENTAGSSAVSDGVGVWWMTLTNSPEPLPEPEPTPPAEIVPPDYLIAGWLATATRPAIEKKYLPE